MLAKALLFITKYITNNDKNKKYIQYVLKNKSRESCTISEKVLLELHSTTTTTVVVVTAQNLVLYFTFSDNSRQIGKATLSNKGTDSNLAPTGNVECIGIHSVKSIVDKSTFGCIICGASQYQLYEF